MEGFEAIAQGAAGLGVADAAAAACLAALTGLFMWGLSEVGRAQVVQAVRAAADAVRTEVGLVLAIPAGWVEGLAARLGRGGGGRKVTLGEVSEMIDIVRLGLLAGLSFDAALELYCEGRSGALAARMTQARLSWQTGLSTREEALMAVAHDLDIRALETFAVAVGQALELGAPLADTLAAQSAEIRAAHRAEVERQIERAPVKLLIPTGTLILPALLISIMGPLMAGSGML